MQRCALVAERLKSAPTKRLGANARGVAGFLWRLAPILLTGTLWIAAGCSVTPPAIVPPPVPPSEARFERNAALELSGSGATTLEIRCGRGNLEVIGVEGLGIEVRGAIEARARNLQEAERLANAVNIVAESENTANPVIVVQEPQLGNDGERFATDLVIKAPPGVRIIVRDGAGNIKIAGFNKGLDLQNPEGTVSINNVKGGVRVTHRGELLEITHCEGVISVDDGPGALAISECSGEVRVHDNRGRLFIGFITGDVTAYNNPDGCEIRSIVGNVMLVGIPAENSVISDATETRFSSAKDFGSPAHNPR